MSDSPTFLSFKHKEMLCKGKETHLVGWDSVAVAIWKKSSFSGGTYLLKGRSICK